MKLNQGGNPKLVDRVGMPGCLQAPARDIPPKDL
jgi:hypothetical protein